MVINKQRLEIQDAGQGQESQATANGVAMVVADDQAERLQELAARVGVPPQQLLRLALEEFLNGLDASFQQEADAIFRKYAELYRRLA
jgi:hypothetical protein